MTNSLNKSLTLGTKFSIAATQGAQSSESQSVAIDALGYIASTFSSSDSEAASVQGAGGIEITHFRASTITADNDKVIDSVHWGPLGDLFVILVNPTFAAVKRADGNIFYSPTTFHREQFVVVPAWKLLRPGTDPIASQIPEQARRNILELDPFFTNLDPFFPDSGAPLTDAFNQYVDPSANNRADLISRWWIDTGALVTYQLNDTYKLSSTQTNQLTYSAKVSVSGGEGTGKEIKAALAVNIDDQTTLTYQASLDTQATFSRNASCVLVRKKDMPEMPGIDIYFDKIFSTFMFRLVRTWKLEKTKVPRPLTDLWGGWGAVVGNIRDRQGAAIRGIQVHLEDESGHTITTSASSVGNYAFFNVPVGRYTLRAGDKAVRINVRDTHSPLNPVSHDFAGVRRLLNIRIAAVWEVMDALQVTPTHVSCLRRTREHIRDARTLARVLGVGREAHKQWEQGVIFSWEKAKGQQKRVKGRN